MPLSSRQRGPEAPRQLANLRSSASVTHGAHSGELIRKSSAEHRANLTRTLPSATPEEIGVQAARMAQIERLWPRRERAG